MSEYGIKHPDGSVTVTITGHPFAVREEAEAEARKLDGPNRFGHCEACAVDDGKGAHEVVSRPDPAPWSSSS